MMRKKLQYFLLEEFEDQGETVMFTPAEGFYPIRMTAATRSGLPM